MKKKRLRDGGKNSNLSVEGTETSLPLCALSQRQSASISRRVSSERGFSLFSLRREGEISSRRNIFPTRQKIGKSGEKSKSSRKARANNKYLRRKETAGFRGGRRSLERFTSSRAYDFFTVSRPSESFPACRLGEPSTVPFSPVETRARYSRRESMPRPNFWQMRKRRKESQYS